ncbi:hypothetical protein F0U60_12495 [Archangium minus]|uniref:Uncharacterized protein n=1 Tax=Archangium minus TaxID=83450 RepID=A0ABY9WLZ2_9BACT|nr:hypothetical protein F0U60_12495 [Archangium minus]
MFKAKFPSFKLPSSPMRSPSPGPSQRPGPDVPSRPQGTPRGPPLQDAFDQQPRGTPRGGPSTSNPSFWSRMSPGGLFGSSPTKQQIKQDVTTLQNTPGGFIKPNSLYHSTSSAAWDGMSKTGGLAPPTMLSQHGIIRKTGEGDQYSAQAGEKNFISFGQGAQGLGTSRAYFKQTANSASYSPHLYSDAQLKAEIDQSKKLLSNWNAPEGKAYGDLVDKPRVQARLRQLEAEQSLRTNMPGRETPYPLMFDFNGDKLNAKPMGMGPGEVAVHGPAMFKDNLQRVFVPADRVADMQSRLNTTLGPGHSVQVLSFEGQTKFLEQQRQSLGRTPNNPAHLALRADENVSSNLSANEDKRKFFYDMAGSDMGVPTI